MSFSLSVSLTYTIILNVLCMLCLISDVLGMLYPFLSSSTSSFFNPQPLPVTLTHPIAFCSLVPFFFLCILHSVIYSLTSVFFLLFHINILSVSHSVSHLYPPSSPPQG